jgi:hypothetical protein
LTKVAGGKVMYVVASFNILNPTCVIRSWTPAESQGNVYSVARKCDSSDISSLKQALACRIRNTLEDLRFSMPSSEMWRRVNLVWTDVSDERIASIFRVDKSAIEEPVWAGGCRLSHQSENTQHIAGSSLVDLSNLNMDAIRSSETSVHTRSTRHHIPEDGILQKYHDSA